MKIIKIKISNFRSITNLTIDIDENNNFISICGANNVGKTNILNALALFFNKLKYVPEKDCPYHKFYGTRGGHYQPKIDVTFKEGIDVHQITKNWNLTKKEKKNNNILFKILWKKNNKEINKRGVDSFIEKINFFYLPSINLAFPETIKYIMNSDIIDLETDKTRMSGKKKKMKESIENVLSDLQSILDTLGKNISPLLKKYKDGWDVAFDLPKEVNTFRDLMIGKIDFYIKDKSNSKAIDAKGAGLQRLCHVLMHFRILEKLNDNKQTVILAIDEPDVHLHSGLQKKLLNDIKKRIIENQIFVTTHSPIFIDTVRLSNVFLLDQKVEDKEYERGKRKSGTKKFNAISTRLVDFNESNGISILKDYLGIEDTDNLLFDKYNILVEGEGDKIYLSKLMQHFRISIPNIIPCNGADNIIKHLEFYDSIAKEESNSSFLIILDNDSEGRKVYNKIKTDKYSNIKIYKKFIVSFSGFNPSLDQNGNNNANIEIEDFIKPEILCYLVNKILKERELNIFKINDIKNISENIKKPAFQNNGILALLENKKNELNPDFGHNIQIDGEGMKSGIANIFSNLNKDIIKLIGEKDNKENNNVVYFLEEISNSDN